jgi:hypothetical protein
MRKGPEGEVIFEACEGNAPMLEAEKTLADDRSAQPLKIDGAPSANNVKMRPGNLYNRMEWAGAFGSIGTLIPFVVAYITIVVPIALFFSDSVSLIIKIFPGAVPGVILFFAGAEPALVVREIGNDKNEFYLMLSWPGLPCGTWV